VAPVTAVAAAASPTEAPPQQVVSAGAASAAASGAAVAAVAVATTTIPAAQMGSSINGVFADNFALCATPDDTNTRRLSIQAITGFDPVEFTQEILVTIVIIVALFFICKFRKQIIILLTGDDRIHANILDFINWFWFRCCGLCSFDWTRHLTGCPCCPECIRSSNLMKAMGRALGVSARTIEISNIVVGDLPFYRHGTFYLTVECAANPPMTTALQEDKNPKTVHFPEIVTLRIRDSYLDSQVSIKVWQLNFVGASELCAVRLTPRNIFDWAYENNGNGSIRRFAMKTMDQELEVETPPWVSMEFSPPTLDERRLDHFHGNITNTVRMATWGTIDQKTQAPYQERDITAFKGDYTLIDGTGRHVNEPPEEDLKWINACRNVIVCIYSTVTFLVTFVVITYAIFRYYVHNCYIKYEAMTIAKSWQPHQFPMPTCALRSIEESCHEQLQGTGVEEGSHICRPTDEMVIDTCENPPQDRPRAFQYIADDLHIPAATAPCYLGVCKTNQYLRSFDKEALIAGSCLLIFALCCFRPLANHWLELYKSRLQKEHNRQSASTRPGGR